MKQRFISVIFFASLWLLPASAFAQNKKTIKEYGLLPFNGSGYIINKSYPIGSVPADTLQFKNGIATLTQDKYDGDIGWLYLTALDPSQIYYMIYEKGTITFTATKDSMLFITGTPNNDAQFELDKELEPIKRKFKALRKESMGLDSVKDKEKIGRIAEEAKKNGGLWWDKQMKFALNNSNMAGLNCVNRAMSRFSTAELKIILENYKHFSDKAAYKNVKRRYEAELKTDIGVTPPAFVLVSDNGKMISLAAVKKKLTIVDFWASWCKPCRAENPNLIRLYSKWKDKGLEIVSVSIDKEADKEKWLNAIKDDRLTWLQAWDEKGTSNKDYGITAIPRTFLIDEAGKIVAKDLRGEELNKFVENYLSGDK